MVEDIDLGILRSSARALETGHLSPRELYEWNLGGRAPLLRTPKDMLSKALEMGVCFHKGPAFGEHGGTFLSFGL